MAAKKLGIALPSATFDLFSNQQQRDAEKNGAIQDIEVAQLQPFPNHPYGVRDDAAMAELVSSISEQGIMEPLLVMPAKDDDYIVVSGHRRLHAAKLLGIDHVPARIKKLSEEEAIIAMTDANLHRPEILPSEKAKAYAMRMDALSRKPGRKPRSKNGAPVEHHFLQGAKSIDVLAEQVGESHEQVRRYLRIAKLIPPLLALMDAGDMKMRPAVELSYLDEDHQRLVLDAIEAEACTPTHDQAIRIRKMFEEKVLSEMSIETVMRESKPNQEETIKVRLSDIARFIPHGASKDETVARIIKALQLLTQAEQAKAAKSA